MTLPPDVLELSLRAIEGGAVAEIWRRFFYERSGYPADAGSVERDLRETLDATVETLGELTGRPECFVDLRARWMSGVDKSGDLSQLYRAVCKCAL